MTKAKVISQGEVSKWVSEMLQAGQSVITIISLFGGDRLFCIDEAVAVKEGGRIIGLATIAPQGEQMSGVPTIVGIYVLPEHRGRGLGRQLLEAAISRCQKRGFNVTPAYWTISFLLSKEGRSFGC